MAGAATHHAEQAAGEPLLFEAIYDEHFDFVWRSARRLGVEEGSVDDVVQEVFLVIHRRLGEFEKQSSLRTWIFAITLRTVSEHRRSLRRKSPPSSADPEALADQRAGPHEAAARAQAAALLQRFLDSLDDDKRAVFILGDLEGMTAPEIAEATAANINTVYARLRAARIAFEEAVRRHHRREREA